MVRYLRGKRKGRCGVEVDSGAHVLGQSVERHLDRKIWERSDSKEHAGSFW